MRLLFISDHNTPSMDKLCYFFLQTERMIPIWIEDAEDWSKRPLTDGLKNILVNTKYASSVVL